MKFNKLSVKMKLSSLETTLNPNCMKLNFNEQIVEKPLSLQRGQTEENVPDVVKQLLDIEGVQGAFVAPHFITLTRKGNADWQTIRFCCSSFTWSS